MSFKSNFHISDFQEELASINKRMTSLETICIRFDYPLSKRVLMKFTHAGGFTRKDFYQAVYEGYTRIYEEPEKHGIWGHAMEDLYLEGVEEAAPGKYRLIVGS